MRGIDGIDGSDEEDEIHGGDFESEDWRDTYLKRPAEPEDVLLYDWFLWFYKIGRRFKKLERQCKIVNIWPAYHPGPDGSEDQGNWAWERLLLHHPHHIEAGLRNAEETWEQAYM